jgi:hypothetical protein
VFEGEYRRGCPDGQGTYSFAGGVAHVGRWCGGALSGDGVAWSASRLQAWSLRDGEEGVELSPEEGAALAARLGLPVPPLTQGSFEGTCNAAGLPHGRGVWDGGDGNVYAGSWSCGSPHGRGTRTWADGHTFDGEFCRGKKEGRGTMTYPTGDTFAGEWVGGLQEGTGTTRYHDGKHEVVLIRGGRQEGALWSANRARAWRVEADGSQGPEISLEKARVLAEKTGLRAP